MHSFDRETNNFERDSLFIFNRSRVSEKEYFHQEKRSGWAGIRSAISSGYVNSLVWSNNLSGWRSKQLYFSLKGGNKRAVRLPLFNQFLNGLDFKRFFNSTLVLNSLKWKVQWKKSRSLRQERYTQVLSCSLFTFLTPPAKGAMGSGGLTRLA